MSMRSENVPESPSSALQAMYFCAAFWSCTVCHLMPVGNAAPPRPRRPESVTARTMSRGGIGERRAQTDVAAMRDVVVDVGRIDDAEARAGEPLLAAQPVGWCRCRRVAARASRRRASRRRAAWARRRRAPDRRPRGRRRSPLRPAAPASTSPREPLRTMRIGSSRRAALARSMRAGDVASAPSDTALASPGTIDGDVARALMRARPSSSAMLAEALRASRLPCSSPFTIMADGAQAQLPRQYTGFERDLAIGARLAEVDAAALPRTNSASASPFIDWQASARHSLHRVAARPACSRK